MNRSDGARAGGRAGELRRQAHEHLRRAEALLAEARRAEPEPRSGDVWPGLVDFDALPGRSPRTRAEALYMGRRIRDGMFPQDLFGELAWDILLELYQSYSEGTRIPLSKLCPFATSIRATLARYVTLMVDSDLIEIDWRGIGDADALVGLSERGGELMHRFFAATDGQSVGPIRLG